MLWQLALIKKDNGENNMKAKKIIGISIGTLTLIFGLVMLGYETGSQPSYAAFGADFFTDTYLGIRETANNICLLAKIAKDGFSFILISIGCWQIFMSLFDNTLNLETQIHSISETITKLLEKGENL